MSKRSRPPATLRLDRRIRTTLVTETRGAAALLAATLLAVVWANLPGGSYEAVWRSEFIVGFGDARIAEDLRHWVNDGLMVFFFLLAGMEIRRELSFGDLSDRRAALVPIMAAVGGIVVPAVIFAILTAGTSAQQAWGMAMATDIAFALGVLALIGPRCRRTSGSSCSPSRWSTISARSWSSQSSTPSRCIWSLC